MIPISFRESGEGLPLVLIHGFCESARIWDEFVPLLGAGLKVYAIDLPGFGNSPLPVGEFKIEDVAEEIYQWMSAHALKKPVVIGHSLGGYVALALANAHRDAISGLGLFHSTATADSEEKRQNRDKVIAFVTQNGVKPFIETYVPGLFYDKKGRGIEKTYRIAYQTDKGALIGYSRAMRDRKAHLDLLKEFVSPVLLLGGQFDTVIPLDQLEMQSKLLKKGTFSVLAHTAHMGLFEAPQDSATIVAQFARSCM